MWIWLALLLLGAFLVRAGAAIWWQHHLAGPQQFFFPDSQSYWHLAWALASGEPYQFGTPDAQVFRMPGYPLVLVPVFWLGGPEVPVLWARLWGAVLGVIPVGCCWWLGRRLFGSKAGWLAGIMAAVYPEAVAASILVLSEAAFCPLLCLQLVVLVFALQSRRPRQALAYALAAGLLGGMGTLVRPSWLWFTPLAAIWTLFGSFKTTGRRETSGLEVPGRSSSPQASASSQAPSQQASVFQQGSAFQQVSAFQQASPFPQVSSQQASVPGASAQEASTVLKPDQLVSQPGREGAAGLLLWARLAMAGLMLGGMILPMAPWWIRNYRLIGRWVPTTLQVGASLYDGLHPGATGKSQMEFFEEFARSERWLLNYRGPEVRMLDPGRWEADPNVLAAGAPPEPATSPAEPLSPTEEPASRRNQAPSGPKSPEQPAQPVLWEYWLDRALVEEALGWASRHPAEVIRLAGKKFWRMWTPWPNEPSLAASPLAAVLGGTYLPILLAGFLALGQTGRRGGLVWLLALPALYLSLVHMVFVSSVRYRGPAMLGWLVLAAAWAAEKLPVLRQRANARE